MDFEQTITQDFDADDIDIFAELGALSESQPVTSDPLQNILLEEDDPVKVDPPVVAELLQVLGRGF